MKKTIVKASGIFLVLALATLAGYATTNTSNKQISGFKSEIPSDETMWKLMIGKWYGSQPMKEGGVREELITRAPDGTYLLQFQFHNKDGSKTEQVEAGHWGISGPIYFSIFRGWVENGRLRPSDPTDPYNYDAYQIIKLNEEVFEYKHLSSGNEFVIKKVSPHFEFLK